MLKNVKGGVVFVLLLSVLCVWALRQPALQIPLGIDLQGGTEFLYRIDLIRVEGQDLGIDGARNIAEEVKTVIANRIDSEGLKEISVSVIGSDLLLIELPGKSDEELESVRRKVEEAGVLTFRLVAEPSLQTDEAIAQYEQDQGEYEDGLRQYLEDLREGRAATLPSKPERVVIREKDTKDKSGAITAVGKKYVAENRAEFTVDGSGLKQCAVGRNAEGFPEIQFEFAGAHATQFATLTGEYKGRLLAIDLDGTAVQVATINNRIGGAGRIEGSFSEEEANTTVAILNAGSLPATLVLEHQQTIGSVLGRSSIDSGLQAMGAGLVLVVLFMIIYYMSGGVLADLAMAFNLLLIVTCLAVFRTTLTFPGMAGLLLTIGMTVDANILIFERIREERLRGRSLAQAVTLGFQKAFSTIFDANLTTLLTAYILYEFGTGPVKGFAVVLCIGIIMSFFTSIYVTRLLMSVGMHLGFIKEFRMLQVAKDPNFDFLKLQKPMIRVSVTFIVIGLGFLIVRGDKALGLDFTGGSRLVVNLDKQVEKSRIHDMVAGMKSAGGGGLFEDVQVQAVGDGDADSRLFGSFAIRTRTADLDVADRQGIGPDGQPREMSATEVFKRRVEDSLRDQQLLAPAPFRDPSYASATGVYEVTAHVHDPAKVLQAEMVRSSLQRAGFPVDKVMQQQNGGGLHAAFRITSTSLTASEESTRAALESLGFDLAAGQEPPPGMAMRDLAQRALGTVLGDSQEVTLSVQFPSVDAIGSKVAQDLQGKIFVAMMIAFGVIVFYVSLRFQFKFGLAAIVALVHDIFFTLGALAIADALLGDLLSLKISLSVMAALLTVVGYSLNDTIVIFDRIRENLTGKKRDVDYPATVNGAINQTLRRTILTSATTFVVVAILLIWGGEPLQGFAFAMCVGVAVGTYSSMYIASPALIYFHRRSEARREAILAEAAAS